MIDPSIKSKVLLGIRFKLSLVAYGSFVKMTHLIRNIKNSEDFLRNGKRYHIDTSMVTSKALNFCYAGKSCYEPYIILFFISIGLNPIQAGFVGGIRLIGTIAGGFLWGILADSKKCYRAIIVLSSLGNIVTMMLQPLLSLWIGAPGHNKCPTEVVPVMNSTVRGKNKTLPFAQQFHSYENNHLLFYTILLINILQKIFESCHPGFADSGVMEKCRTQPNQPSFGFQRMFGPIGFTTAVLLTNLILDYFPEAGITCYTAIFLMNSLFSMGYLINGYILYTGLKFNHKEKIKNKSIIEKLKKMLSFQMLFFLLTVLVMGIVYGVFLNFTSLLVKDIDAPNIITGISFAVSGIATMLAYFFGERMITILRGTWNSLFLCFFSYFVRFLAMYYLQNPWLLPLLQMLHGLGFGLFMISCIHHIKDCFEPEIRTTIYSVFNTLQSGVGVIIVNIAAGKIYKDFNARTLFLLASLFALTWSMFIVVYNLTKKFFKLFPKRSDVEIEMLSNTVS